MVPYIFLFRSDTVEGDTRVPHNASVMSSTRRTDTPARYISISASSTELSRRRYRSMIAVSNVCWRSFLQFSQIRGCQPYLIVRKILYVIRKKEPDCEQSQTQPAKMPCPLAPKADR